MANTKVPLLSLDEVKKKSEKKTGTGINLLDVPTVSASQRNKNNTSVTSKVSTPSTGNIARTGLAADSGYTAEKKSISQQESRVSLGKSLSAVGGILSKAQVSSKAEDSGYAAQQSEKKELAKQEYIANTQKLISSMETGSRTPTQSKSTAGMKIAEDMLGMTTGRDKTHLEEETVGLVQDSWEKRTSQYLSDSQRKTLQRFAEAGDYAAVKEYYDAISSELNAKYTEAQVEQEKKNTKDSKASSFTNAGSKAVESGNAEVKTGSGFASAALESTKTGLMNAVSGIPAYLDALASEVVFQTTGKYRPTDVNGEAYLSANLTRAAQEGLSEKIDTQVDPERYKSLNKLAHVTSNAWSSAVTNMTQVLLTGGYSGGGKLAEQGTRVMMGAGVAGQEFTQRVQSGEDEGRALTNATAAGLLEYLTEAIPMHNYLDAVAQASAGKMTRQAFIKYFAAQAGAESAEEVVNNVAGNLWDMWYNGDDSDFHKLVEEYKKNGITDENEAKAQAYYKLFLLDSLEAAATAAISTVFMNAVPAHSTFKSVSAQGAELKAQGNDEIQLYIEGALATADPKSEVYKLASKAQEKLNAGRELTNLEAGNLAVAMEQHMWAEIQKADAEREDDIVSAYTFAQEGSTSFSTAKARSAIFTRLASGEKVSDAEIESLNLRSPVTQQIYEKYTGQTLAQEKSAALRQMQSFGEAVQKRDIALQAEDAAIEQSNAELDAKDREAAAVAETLAANSPTGEVTAEEVMDYQAFQDAYVQSNPAAEKAEITKAYVEYRRIEQQEKAAIADQLLTRGQESDKVSVEAETSPVGSIMPYADFRESYRKNNPKAGTSETRIAYQEYLDANQKHDIDGRSLTRDEFIAEMTRQGMTEEEAYDLYDDKIAGLKNKEVSEHGGQSVQLQNENVHRGAAEEGSRSAEENRRTDRSGTEGGTHTRAKGERGQDQGYDRAESEGAGDRAGEVKLSRVKGKNTSNPQFTPAEWDIVNRLIRTQKTDPRFDIDGTDRFLYYNRNGITIFALYNLDVDGEVVVTAGYHGKLAERKYQKLSIWLEADRYEKSTQTDRDRRSADDLLADIKSEKRDSGAGLYLSGERGSDAGDVRVSVEESGSDRRGDLGKNGRDQRRVNDEVDAASDFGVDAFAVREYLKDSDSTPKYSRVAETDSDGNPTTDPDIRFSTIKKTTTHDLGIPGGKDNTLTQVENPGSPLTLEAETLIKSYGFDVVWVTDDYLRTESGVVADGLTDFKNKKVYVRADSDFADSGAIAFHELSHIIVRNKLSYAKAMSAARGVLKPEFFNELSDIYFDRMADDFRSESRDMSDAEIRHLTDEELLGDLLGGYARFNETFGACSIFQKSIRGAMDQTVRGAMDQTVRGDMLKWSASENHEQKTAAQLQRQTEREQAAAKKAAAEKTDSAANVLARTQALLDAEQARQEMKAVFEAFQPVRPKVNAEVTVPLQIRDKEIREKVAAAQKRFKYDAMIVRREERLRELKAELRQQVAETELSSAMNAGAHVAKDVTRANAKFEEIKRKADEQKKLLSQRAREAKSTASYYQRAAEEDPSNDVVDTIRKLPGEEDTLQARDKLLPKLKSKVGAPLYRAFVNQVQAIDTLSKRQTGVKAGSLINILHSSSSTSETIFQTALVGKDGQVMGAAMKDVMLMWEGEGRRRKVDTERQAILQDYLLHRHNIDRMGIKARARREVQAFEEKNPWLRELTPNELALLVAEGQASWTERNDIAVQYKKLMDAYLAAKNKPIFADSKGRPVTAATSKTIVSEYEQKYDWLAPKAEEIYGWWDSFMTEWAVGSTVSTDAYELMRSMYPSYVPTYRVGKGVGAAASANGAISPGQAVKKATGSTKEVEAIEESFARLVNKIVRLQRTNELLTNLIDTAMEDSDGIFAKELQFDWAGYYDGNGAYGESMVTGAWLNGASAADLEDSAAGEALTKEGQYYKISGWYNGEKLSAYVNEDIYKALESVVGSKKDKLDMLTRAGNRFTGPMKTMITGINPFFAVRNVSRDLPTALINSTAGFSFVKYYAQAWQEIAKNTAHWKQFQALGGTNNGYYSQSKTFSQQMQTEKGVLSKATEKLGVVNELTESATRFAEYLATIDRQGDTYEARIQGIKNAAEVTVDFSRRGTYGGFLNAWIPYWNPAVQGIDKVMRSVVANDEGVKGAMKTATRGMLLAALPEAFLYVILKSTGRWDDWEELSDRTKHTYYCIPVGEHSFIKIAKNREWSAVLGTPLMALLEKVNGREDPLENYLVDTLAVNFVPGGIEDAFVFGTILELQTNKDFAGRTIIPSQYQGVDKSAQWDSETSMLAMALSRAMLSAFSPMQIDYVLHDYFGDFISTLALDIPNMGWTNGDFTFDDVGALAADFAKGSFVADNRYSSQAINDYYTVLDDLEQEYKTLKLTDPDYQNSQAYQMYQAISSGWGNDISALYKERNALKDGPEKDAVQMEIVGLAQEALAFYKEATESGNQNPVLTVKYMDFDKTVSDELIRLDKYTQGDNGYSFKPSTYKPKSITQDDLKYTLDDAAVSQYERFYRQEYNDIFFRLILTPQYRNARDEAKAEMLEAARDEVLAAAKADTVAWMKGRGYPATQK